MDSGRHVKETKPEDQVKIKRPGEAEDPNLRVHFSSVAQLYLTLCDPMDSSMPFPVYHQVPELTQTHVH